MATLRWTNCFKLLDQNNSGTVEPADASFAIQIIAKGGFNAPQLELMKQAITEGIAGIISSADTNKDGKVTLAELLAIANSKYIGKPFDVAPDWWKACVAKIFAAVDVNNNGVITIDEYVGIIVKLIPSVNVDVCTAVFQNMQGVLNIDLAQKNAWNWLTSFFATPEDIFLTLAVALYCTPVPNVGLGVGVGGINVGISL